MAFRDIFTCGIIALLVTEAFDSIAGMFLMPVLPFQLGNEGLTPLQINLIQIVPMILGGISQGVLGQLSDRAGRKTVLLVALVFESMSYIGLAYFPAPPMLILFSALMGAASGTDGVIQAYMADNVLDENIPLVMQVKSTVKSLGTSAGAAVGSTLYMSLGWKGMCFCLAAFCSPQLIVGGFFWSSGGSVRVAASTVSSVEEGTVSAESTNAPKRGLADMLSHFRDPNIGPLLMLGMTTFSGMMATFAILPFVLKDHFDYTPQEYGRCIGGVGISIFIFTQTSAWQVRYFGERACIAISNVISAIAPAWLVFAAMYKLQWGPWIMVLWTSFQVPLNIAATAWLNRLAPQELRGEINGVFGAACALCAAIMGPLSSWVYDFNWWLPYIASSIILFASVPLVWLPASGLPTKSHEPLLPVKSKSQAEIMPLRLHSRSFTMKVPSVLEGMTAGSPINGQQFEVLHGQYAEASPISSGQGFRRMATL